MNKKFGVALFAIALGVGTFFGSVVADAKTNHRKQAQSEKTEAVDAATNCEVNRFCRINANCICGKTCKGYVNGVGICQ